MRDLRAVAAIRVADEQAILELTRVFREAGRGVVEPALLPFAVVHQQSPEQPAWVVDCLGLFRGEILGRCAVAEEETVVQAIESFAEDYVRKPFKPRELVARVERVCRRIGDFGYTLEPVMQQYISSGTATQNRTADPGLPQGL